MSVGLGLDILVKRSIGCMNVPLISMTQALMKRIVAGLFGLYLWLSFGSGWLIYLVMADIVSMSLENLLL